MITICVCEWEREKEIRWISDWMFFCDTYNMRFSRCSGQLQQGPQQCQQHQTYRMHVIIFSYTNANAYIRMCVRTYICRSKLSKKWKTIKVTHKASECMYGVCLFKSHLHITVCRCAGHIFKFLFRVSISVGKKVSIFYSYLFDFGLMQAEEDDGRSRIAHWLPNNDGSIYSPRNADAIQWNSLKSTHERSRPENWASCIIWCLCPYLQQVMIINKAEEKNEKLMALFERTIIVRNWPNGKNASKNGFVEEKNTRLTRRLILSEALCILFAAKFLACITPKCWTSKTNAFCVKP